MHTYRFTFRVFSVSLGKFLGTDATVIKAKSYDDAIERSESFLEKLDRARRDLRHIEHGLAKMETGRAPLTLRRVYA